jgi:uncharacterized protein involved in outer membrane biogenesis
MKALRWIIISLAVIVVVVVLGIAVGGMWLNTFIHSDSFKREVETRAGQSLGGAVQIESIDFDIWHGIKLKGLVTQLDPTHVNGQGALLANVAGVDCAYSWPDLLHRQLKLTGVTLDKPQIVLTRQATAPLAPTPSAPSGPASSGNGAGPATSAGTSAPFQFVLDQATLNDGAFAVRDAAGVSIIALQGIDVSARTAGYYEGKDVTGSVRISDVALPSNMHVTSFSTPFTYGRGTFEAKPFDATAFNGRIAGDYLLGGSGPSILNLNAKGFDLAQLTAATTSDSSAKLTGSLDLQSKWRSVETGAMEGEGDAQLANGKIEGVKLLQQLSQLFRVKELEEPVISQAKTHFLVGNNQTRFTGLQAQSAIFQLTGDGVIGFNGSLDANMVLILTSDAMKKLPSQAAASFIQQQDGSGSVAFHVFGTTANPQTDLATRLLMQNTQIQNIISKQLNRFFQKKDTTPQPQGQ